MGIIDPITEFEVRELANDWYRKLSDKASIDEYVPLLAQKELKMEFPNGEPVHGFDGFKDWYESVTHTFFDQVHTLKELKVTPSADKADVKVIVHWEASLWQPPAAKSQRVVLDAYQTWVVKRSPTTQKPVIQSYVVDSLEYAEGSARL